MKTEMLQRAASASQKRCKEIAKGYYDNNGNKRYKKSFGFSDSQEMRKFIVDSINELPEVAQKKLEVETNEETE